MIDKRVLRKCGTTDERLKEVFTAKRPDNFPELSEKEQARIDADIARREAWEKRIQIRLDTHTQRSLQDYALFGAVDLAWDSPPINKETIPLLQYAQGRIDLGQCAAGLTSLSCAQQYVRKDGEKITGIDMPAFFEHNINLVRSVITRRHSAQTNKYRNLFPYYKYDPRTTSEVGRLKSDALSMVTEIIVDSYDYRGHDDQVLRDTMLYTTVWDFVANKWDRQLAWRAVDGQGDDVAPENLKVEGYVAKEGLDWVLTHPTRTFCDFAVAPRRFNSDTVPVSTYCGYWDVNRYGVLKNNPDFWNRDQLRFSQGWLDLLSTYPSYFSQYYKTISPPPVLRLTMPSTNDRFRNIGLYSAEENDNSCLVAVYFEKIIPVDEGFGTYPYPVWVRLVCGGTTGTVMFAELLPSTPAAVSSLNAKDDRQLNISLAMQLLPYQDQLTNLFSHMLALCKVEQFLGIGCDTDLIADPKIQAELKATITGKDWFAKRFFLTYSGAHAQALGINLKENDGPIRVWQAKPSPQSIQTIFQAITQLLAIVERLEGISANESGQPITGSNGGVTATEAAQIGQTTNTMFNFISDSHDAFREAKKRIVFESWMTEGKEEFRVPVTGRYPAQTVLTAGLEPYIEDGPETRINESQAWTVSGRKAALWYEFYYSSRDGAERPVSVQSANTLVGLLPVIVQNTTIMEAMGKDKFYQLINEIFRLSGAAFDLNLEVHPGETNSFGQSQDSQAQIDQIAGLIEQLSGTVNKVIGDVQGLQQSIQQMAQQNDQKISQVAQQGAQKVDEVTRSTTQELQKRDSDAAMREMNTRHEMNMRDLRTGHQIKMMGQKAQKARPAP